MKWEEKCYQLWRIIDNIDTASDVFKIDKDGLISYIQREQGRRWEYLTEAEVEQLYKSYYPQVLS